jgi:hypothetical protein
MLISIPLFYWTLLYLTISFALFALFSLSPPLLFCLYHLLPLFPLSLVSFYLFIPHIFVSCSVSYFPPVSFYDTLFPPPSPTPSFSFIYIYLPKSFYLFSPPDWFYLHARKGSVLLDFIQGILLFFFM